VLGQEPVLVAARDQALEERARFAAATSAASASTYQKVHTANAFSGTPKSSRDCNGTPKSPRAGLSRRAHRSGKARIVRAQEIQLVQQQQARIQILAAEGRGEARALSVPGASADRGVHRVGARPPVARALGKADAQSDLREAVARRPAITLENVCTAFVPRNSHGPASGCRRARRRARRACSSCLNSAWSLRSASRASKNTCAAASTAAP